MIEAEVRALYFADLTSRYTKRKQIITGVSFFFSSAAAATVATQMYYAPLFMSAVVAFGTAYSIAVGLDRKVLTMAKLYSEWSKIATDSERLWNHWYDEDAEDTYRDLDNRSREWSATGTTEAPYDERTFRRWEDHVIRIRGLAAAA